MCGIALIICGVRFLLPNTTPPATNSDQLQFTTADLVAALRRRGPDSLGAKKLLLRSSSSKILTSIDGVEKEFDDWFSAANGRTPYMYFFGATLQLRGLNPVLQPLIDSYKNVLVYNGEIFGGIDIASEENDGEVLMGLLGECEGSVPNVVSRIKGPWAMIYWQESSRTLWFGRDAFGRRSLLVHWPTVEDSWFLLSSVSPVASDEHSAAENGTSKLGFWEELPCGIYSLSIDAPDVDGFLIGEVKKHEWTNAMLEGLIKWERASVEPKPEELNFSPCEAVRGQHNMNSLNADIVPMPSESGSIQASISVPAETVLIVLRESVLRRSSLHKIYQAGVREVEKNLVPVAVFFSGGVDSMIIAALFHECLDSRCKCCHRS